MNFSHEIAQLKNDFIAIVSAIVALYLDIVITVKDAYTAIAAHFMPVVPVQYTGTKIVSIPSLVKEVHAEYNTKVAYYKIAVAFSLLEENLLTGMDPKTALQEILAAMVRLHGTEKNTADYVNAMIVLRHIALTCYGLRNI